jgi:hypothetical protein
VPSRQFRQLQATQLGHDDPGGHAPVLDHRRGAPVLDDTVGKPPLDEFGHGHVPGRVQIPLDLGKRIVQGVLGGPQAAVVLGLGAAVAPCDEPRVVTLVAPHINAEPVDARRALFDGPLHAGPPGPVQVPLLSHGPRRIRHFFCDFGQLSSSCPEPRVGFLAPTSVPTNNEVRSSGPPGARTRHLGIKSPLLYPMS